MAYPRRRVAAAITLFFVAPLVAEFLLGNLPLKLLPALIVLAPMYGGGALLIRDMARRAGRGWPTMFLLGATYGLLEEGFATQSLFNPDYLKLHLHLLDHAFIPALGIGAWWTILVSNLHIFWSIGVSIALVEALFPGHAASPWLGKVGDSFVALLFILGFAANARFTFKQDPFLASHAQFLTTGLVCVLLTAAAFLLPRRIAPLASSRPPSPWLCGIVAFLFGIAVLIIPATWNLTAVFILLALDAAFLALLLVFSQRQNWTPLHTCSLASGGALAYGLHAFFEHPVVAGTLNPRIGNTIFLAAALAVIALGVRRSPASTHSANDELTAAAANNP